MIFGWKTTKLLTFKQRRRPALSELEAWILRWSSTCFSFFSKNSMIFCLCCWTRRPWKSEKISDLSGIIQKKCEKLGESWIFINFHGILSCLEGICWNYILKNGNLQKFMKFRNKIKKIAEILDFHRFSTKFSAFLDFFRDFHQYYPYLFDIELFLSFGVDLLGLLVGLLLDESHHVAELLLHIIVADSHGCWRRFEVVFPEKHWICR